MPPATRPVFFYLSYPQPHFFPKTLSCIPPPLWYVYSVIWKEMEMTPTTTTILKGHVSRETAYVVDDYPYGFRLRCKIRYWLEHTKNGVRFVSETTNPKRGHVWNKPKASTYARFGGCMYLTDNGHVHWSGLTEYTDGAEAKAWMEKFGEGVPETAKKLMTRWVNAKVAYDTAREPMKTATGEIPSLEVGLVEAHKAFIAS